MSEINDYRDRAEPSFVGEITDGEYNRTLEVRCTDGGLLVDDVMVIPCEWIDHARSLLITPPEPCAVQSNEVCPPYTSCIFPCAGSTVQDVEQIWVLYQNSKMSAQFPSCVVLFCLTIGNISRDSGQRF